MFFGKEAKQSGYNRLERGINVDVQTSAKAGVTHRRIAMHKKTIGDVFFYL